MNGLDLSIVFNSVRFSRPGRKTSLSICLKPKNPKPKNQEKENSSPSPDPKTQLRREIHQGPTRFPTPIPSTFPSIPTRFLDLQTKNLFAILAEQSGFRVSAPKMSTRNRRAPPSSGNRAPIPQNPNKKAMAAKPQVAKKRTALCDVTNQRNGSQTGPWSSASSLKPMVRRCVFVPL